MPVEVRWRPFFLNKDLPKEGVDKRAYYVMRFGKQRFEEMVPFMKSQGVADGVNFSYGGRIGNTLDAHRALEYALHQGGVQAQDTVQEEIFQNYFEQEKDISDQNILVQALQKAFPEKSQEALLEFLSSSQLVQDINQSAQALQSKYRITGVPFFICRNTSNQREITVSGAQGPAHFVQVFDELLSGEE